MKGSHQLTVHTLSKKVLPSDGRTIIIPAAAIPPSDNADQTHVLYCRGAVSGQEDTMTPSAVHHIIDTPDSRQGPYTWCLVLS